MTGVNGASRSGLILELESLGCKSAGHCLAYTYNVEFSIK